MGIMWLCSLLTTMSLKPSCFSLLPSELQNGSLKKKRGGDPTGPWKTKTTNNRKPDINQISLFLFSMRFPGKFPGNHRQRHPNPDHITSPKLSINFTLGGMMPLQVCNRILWNLGVLGEESSKKICYRIIFNVHRFIIRLLPRSSRIALS